MTGKDQITKEVFRAMQVVFGVGMVLEGMDEVKYTGLYNSKVEKELELYDKRKLKQYMWSGNGVPDEVADMMDKAKEILFASVHIANNQPENVSKRFYDELKNMFVRYGVNMSELEKV